MRKNKTISTFSIAAFALLAAAVPGYSQTGSIDSRTEKSGIAAPGSGLQLSFNTAPRFSNGFTEAEKVMNTTPVRTSPSSSAPRAKIQFSTVERKLSFASQFSIYEVPSLKSKNQFSSDDEAGPQRSKNHVTFVPSRGQKIPG
jgi:hypothetical protein